MRDAAQPQLRPQRQHGESAASSSCGGMAGKRRRHPFLTAVAVVYMAAHARQLHVAAMGWLACLLAGHALTLAATAKLVLALFEGVTVFATGHLMHGLLRGITNAQLADRGLVILGFIMPVFQVLMAIASPEFLTVKRAWTSLLAINLMLGVVFGLMPTHSLIQLAVSVPFFAFMQCCGSCFHHDCNTTVAGIINCLLRSSWIIMVVGTLAWSATYAVARGQMRRQREARKGRAGAAATSNLPAQAARALTRTASMVSLTDATPNSAQHSVLSQQQHQQQVGGSLEQLDQGGLRLFKHTLSSLYRRQRPGSSLRPQSSTPSSDLQQPSTQTQPASASADAALQGPQRSGSRPGEPAAGTGAGSTPSSSRPTAHATEDLPAEPSPLPFTSFGIHIFERLGVEWLLREVEVRVNALMDCADDGLVVRTVCMPLAGYSLILALLVRMRMSDFDFRSLSPDTVIMFMGVWFMLGRDSYTFDMTAAVQQLHEQLSSSLASLGQQRPQTVAELVDSVRQQIAGGSSAPGVEGNIEGEELQVLELLGEGTFGKVYKGIWRGTVVAIKSMVLPSNAGLRRERMAIMEAAISAALSHPNILQTYTYILQPVRDRPAEESRDANSGTGSARRSLDSQSGLASGSHGFEVRLVLEYMDRGTLRDALDSGVFLSPSGDGVNYVAVLETAAEVAKGMLHLHSLNILHGDLKARNVLLKSSMLDDRGFTSKIGDFGLSQKMEELETHISSMFQGTPSHMAPEVFMEGTQSKAADVYAFGITLWEIYTGRRAFADVAKALLPHAVVEKNSRPDFPEGAPQSYRQLAQRCWDKDASKRPSFKEVVSVLAQMQEGVEAVWLPAPAAVTHAFQSGDGGLTVLGSAVTYEAKEDGDVPTDVQEALARWRVAYDQHQREQREAQHVHAQQVAEASRRVSAVAKAKTTPTASAPSSSPPSAPLPPVAPSNSTEHSARPLPEAAAAAGSRAQSREVRLSRNLSSNQPQLVAYGGGSQRVSGQLLQKQQPLSPRVTSSHFVLPEAVEELPSALLVGNQDQAWDDRSLC